MMHPKLFVLMRERLPDRDARPEDVMQTPHAVCGSLDDVEAVIESISLHKDNRKYKMRKTGKSSWEIGPEGDQGFFGHRPMRFWVVDTYVRGSLRELLPQEGGQ